MKGAAAPARMGPLALARLLARLAGRLLELAWLYLPLVLLGVWAACADALHLPTSLGVALGLLGEKAKDWRAAWLARTLRNVQKSGPVFVKLAQWAATRPDFVPETWCQALGYLQDRTDPHSLEHTHKILDESFSRDGWSHAFLIEPEPIGSGCIAQVYRGIAQVPDPDSRPSGPPGAESGCGYGGLWQLLGGAGPRSSGSSGAGRKGTMRAVPVAVKVIHPQVRRAVDLDLVFLQAAAWLVDRLGFESLGVSLALRQFVGFLSVQADFILEANNLIVFRQNFGTGDNDVAIPKVFHPWVTSDVLVMSFEDGEPLSTLLAAGRARAGDGGGGGEEGPLPRRSLKKDREEAWGQIVDSFWAMVFKHRFVHGDLHPGNILWQRRKGRRPRLVLLDCGLAVDLGGDAGEDLAMMVKAFLTQSEEEVAALLMRLGERVGGRLEDVWEPDGFVKGIAELIREAKGCGFRLGKLNAGALMGRSLLLGRRHRVRFDARFVNLMVAMTVLQGVAMSLHPEGDFLSRMTPYLFGQVMRIAA
mmetsp:Transcript_77346/g.202991  ORF Transcript_77346/g.202991 Transcript_77346/m.202991 type:complete len:532 (-) Transcript_77346:6-1601(-)